MSEADEIIQRARGITDARAARYVPPDYAALNNMVRRQRSRLTRAVHTADEATRRERVIIAVRDAVREWSQPGAIWPDDWTHWQRALDDQLDWHERIDIADL